MEEKQYYSIGEVCTMLGVNPSLLRFWEKEIPQVAPRKSAKGTRKYTPEDIEVLKKVYYLTRDCGCTLDGVKARLANSGKLDEKMQLVQTLNEVRAYLVELKKNL